MADTTTPTLNLTKPDFNGAADIRVFSTNMDLIDAAAAATNDALDAATPMTTPGDLIVGGSSGVPGRLGVGTNGQVLAVVAGAPVWAAPTPMTAVGDLIRGGAAGAPTRLPIGAETQALTVVGGVPAWTPPTYGGMTNPMTTPQDIIVGSTGGGPVRLGVGAEGRVLAVTGGVVGWGAPAGTDNLLTNPGFEVWQRGAGPFSTNGAYTADRWRADLAGGATYSLTRIASTVGSKGYSAQVAYTHVGGGAVRVLQAPENYAQLLGKTVTFAVRVKGTVASTVRAFVGDSLSGETYSSYNTGTGEEVLTVTADVAAAATGVTVGVQVTFGTSTAEVNDAVLVVGTAAPAFAPLHPQDDLARCVRYYEVLGSGVFEEPFALGQVRSVAEIRWPLRYAEKAVAPTVTVSAANHFGAWISDFSTAVAFNTLTAQNAGRTSCLMVGGATFTGYVAGQAATIHAYNTAARLRVEANP